MNNKTQETKTIHIDHIFNWYCITYSCYDAASVKNRVYYL